METKIPISKTELDQQRREYYKSKTELFININDKISKICIDLDNHEPHLIDTFNVDDLYLLINMITHILYEKRIYFDLTVKYSNYFKLFSKKCTIYLTIKDQKQTRHDIYKEINNLPNDVGGFVVTRVRIYDDYIDVKSASCNYRIALESLGYHITFAYNYKYSNYRLQITLN